MKIAASRELGFISGCQGTGIQHARNRVLKDEHRQFARLAGLLDLIQGSGEGFQRSKTKPFGSRRLLSGQ